MSCSKRCTVKVLSYVLSNLEILGESSILGMRKSGRNKQRIFRVGRSRNGREEEQGGRRLGWGRENLSKRSQPEAVVYVGSGLAGTSVSMVLGLRLKGFGVRGLLGFFWQGSGT
jgi:hypothetical protein